MTMMMVRSVRRGSVDFFPFLKSSTSSRNSSRLVCSISLVSCIAYRRMESQIRVRVYIFSGYGVAVRAGSRRGRLQSLDVLLRRNEATVVNGRPAHPAFLPRSLPRLSLAVEEKRTERGSTRRHSTGPRPRLERRKAFPSPLVTALPYLQMIEISVCTVQYAHNERN